MTFHKSPTYYKIGSVARDLPSPHDQLLKELDRQYDPRVKLLRGSFVPRYAHPVVKSIFRLCGCTLRGSL